MGSDRFAIAQVTPYAWERQNEVNRFVARLSDELGRKGHNVVVIAPSESRELVRDSRAVIARGNPFPGSGSSYRVLGVGQSLPFPPNRRGSSVSLPIDVARTIEELLQSAAFDFVHVHEPFAPSASSVALRHSRALNVGTFHATTERVLSTQVARRFVELVFGRLDGRTASFAATRELISRYFPNAYRVVRPGADPVASWCSDDARPVRLVYSAGEERAGLRLFLRALRRLPQQLEWEATVWSQTSSAPAVLPRSLRGRVRFVTQSQASESTCLASAQVAVAASSGTSPAPQLLLRAMACGCVPVASRLAEYEELLAEGDNGLLFEPGDVETLAAQLERLIAGAPLRTELRGRVRNVSKMLGWSHTADQIEQLYADIAARRHRPEDPTLRRRLQARELIHVDLHMHTDHSHDCATPVDVLLETAKRRGLGAIAVTDHNEISGALEARRQASGIQVIVGEEVKTADQGEVIGLFIEELIPRGLTLEQTIAEIHRQGGVVYVPHPFDRLHSVPDYEHLLKVVEQIDAMEVFNSRVTVSSFNDEAARFAAKYRIAAGAGSDSHVAQGLGSVRIKMRRFDGPAEFVASLRDADIVRKRQSLLFVQALKFMQTRGGTRRKRKQMPSPSGGNK